LIVAEADQRIDPDRRLRLVVADAAGVEKAVFLHQGERIALPILALGLHYVDMGEKQNGLGLRVGTGKHRHQTAFLGLARSGNQMKVFVAETRGLQPRRHPLRGKRAASFRQSRVGFHQLLVDRAKGGLVGRLRGGGGRERERNRDNAELTQGHAKIS
jgi:hypothetical protein